MAESKRLNVTVPESMYGEWKDAVNEDEVAASISELIRNSVNRNLDGNLGASQGQQGDIQAEPSDEVMGYLQRIDGTLSDVEERIERVEREARTEGLPEGVDWRSVVLQTLPDDTSADVNATPEDYGISTEEYAASIGVDTDTAADLLERVEEQTGLVRSVTGGADNTTFWWRDE